MDLILGKLFVLISKMEALRDLSPRAAQIKSGEYKALSYSARHIQWASAFTVVGALM